MDKSIKIFSTPEILAETFAGELVGMINKSSKSKKNFTLVLSGGSTPERLFAYIGDHFSKSVPWEFVHLFWGDERCVTPDNSESNFGMAKKILIEKIDIPSINVHRIRGESDPETEARRYSNEILQFTDENEGLPVFDMIMLGLGDDGHTASVFPGHLDLITSDKICDIAVHPVTNQKRITLTGKVINNARAIIFLVTGEKKSRIIEDIFKRTPQSTNFPASYIVPASGRLNWYIDKAAGCLL